MAVNMNVSTRTAAGSSNSSLSPVPAAFLVLRDYVAKL